MEPDIIERLRRAQDRLNGFLSVNQWVFSEGEVDTYNDEIERLEDLLVSVSQFKVPRTAFEDAPGQPSRHGRMIGTPKPKVIYASVLREHYCKPAMAAIEREIVNRQRPKARILMTPEQLGNQYVDACLEVARAIAAITLAEPIRREAGVDAYTLRQHMGGKGGGISLARWRSDHELFIHQAVQDLSAPAVGILAGSNADTPLGRRFLSDSEMMIRHIALRELEEPGAGVLRAVLAGSFAPGKSDHLPQQLITDDAVAQAVATIEDDMDVIGQQVDMALRSLNDDGYVDADLFLGGGRVRITFAGIIWLRDHERVTMDEAKRQERVQNNITNYGNLHMGGGDINTTINNFGSARDPESGLAYLRSLGVQESSLAALPDLMAELDSAGEEERGSRLREWVGDAVDNMTTKASSALATAMGTSAADGLRQLVNQIDWSSVGPLT